MMRSWSLLVCTVGTVVGHGSFPLPVDMENLSSGCQTTCQCYMDEPSHNRYSPKIYDYEPSPYHSHYYPTVSRRHHAPRPYNFYPSSMWLGKGRNYGGGKHAMGYRSKGKFGIHRRGKGKSGSRNESGKGKYGMGKGGKGKSSMGKRGKGKRRDLESRDLHRSEPTVQCVCSCDCPAPHSHTPIPQYDDFYYGTDDYGPHDQGGHGPHPHTHTPYDDDNSCCGYEEICDYVGGEGGMSTSEGGMRLSMGKSEGGMRLSMGKSSMSIGKVRKGGMSSGNYDDDWGDDYYGDDYWSDDGQYVCRQVCVVPCGGYPVPRPVPVPRPAPRPVPVPRPVPRPMPRPMPRPVTVPRPVARPVPAPVGDEVCCGYEEVCDYYGGGKGMGMSESMGTEGEGSYSDCYTVCIPCNPVPFPFPRPVPQPVHRPVPQPVYRPVPRPLPAPAPYPAPVWTQECCGYETVCDYYYERACEGGKGISTGSTGSMGSGGSVEECCEVCIPCGPVPVQQPVRSEPVPVPVPRPVPVPKPIPNDPVTRPVPVPQPIRDDPVIRPVPRPVLLPVLVPVDPLPPPVLPPPPVASPTFRPVAQPPALRTFPPMDQSPPSSPPISIPPTLQQPVTPPTPEPVAPRTLPPVDPPPPSTLPIPPPTQQPVTPPSPEPPTPERTFPPIDPPPPPTSPPLPPPTQQPATQPTPEPVAPRTFPPIDPPPTSTPTAPPTQVPVTPRTPQPVRTPLPAPISLPPPAAAPFCGDGIVDSGEQCDDGANGDDTDGCTDGCTFCVCSATAEFDPDSGAVDIEFNYCGEANPDTRDWIGIYPCDAPTKVATQEWWDEVVCGQFRDACGADPMEFGYSVGQAYVDVEPTWFGYTCGPPLDPEFGGCQVNRFDIGFWPSEGRYRIDPNMEGARWAFPGGRTLEPGCYKAVLHRYAQIVSPPPYPIVCAPWVDSPTFTVPALPPVSPVPATVLPPVPATKLDPPVPASMTLPSSPAPFCGDGVVDTGEQCDDGANGDDTDGCKDDCSVCVCSASAEYDANTGALEIDFNLCGETTPDIRDWIGIYPCDAETNIQTQEWWDDIVCAQFPGACDAAFEDFGYRLGEEYVDMEPLWFSYTCGSPLDPESGGCQVNRSDLGFWPSKGRYRIDPNTDGADWAFPGGRKLPPGCYKVVLNRYGDIISPPPYPTVCAPWVDSPTFIVS